ncbi:DUF4371 domain-containing protein [Trichonephila clavipes]|nr:DUF4371 domain-containing protein [Trichonephila clavipes]
MLAQNCLALRVERSTGKELSNLIVEKHLKIGANAVQAYDNGANMRGEKSGVQSRIITLNSRSIYVPCSSHSLNLVINDMAKASLED